MRILVTGGAGFIGSHVVESYQKAGHTVAILDNLSTGKRSNVPSDIAIFEGDITDSARVREVFKEVSPEIVNHHAAQISVTHSVEAPEKDAEHNVVGTLNLLEATRTLPDFKKFIYASTGGAMYGQADHFPIPEDAPVKPLAPYGLSKHVAEQYVWLYQRIYGITATVLRYGNVFGPRQDPHGEAGVFAIFSERMFKGEPITIYGEGKPTRDYVYVGDVAAANLAALEKGDNDYFNIATGMETTTQKVYESLKEVFHYNLSPVYAPLRAGEVERCALSVSKAEKILGWKPETRFIDGAQKTADWYQQKGTSNDH